MQNRPPSDRAVKAAPAAKTVIRYVGPQGDVYVLDRTTGIDFEFKNGAPVEVPAEFAARLVGQGQFEEV